jgi:predicted short-subunit dehydrogenase-like oxidoreductase (DUF2520 family)
MKIGFIGAGKVGTAFGKFLINHGIQVIGYNSRGKESLENAIQYTNTRAFEKEELINAADVIFITVKDDQIQNVIETSINAFSDLKEKTFIHMSGVHSSKVLIAAHRKGADIYALHPLQSVSNIEKAAKDFEDTYFSMESIGKKNKHIEKILSTVNHYFEIEPDQKSVYHMAACIFSNYLTTLMDFGLELTSSIGIDKDKAFEAMLPLINGTIKNIKNGGIEHSLTGPLARGDVETIKSHLASYKKMNQEYKDFYQVMGLKTLDYIEKNRIQRTETINNMRNILEGSHEKDNN